MEVLTIKLCVKRVFPGSAFQKYVFEILKNVYLQHRNDLAAVKQNGMALKYVKDQTDEICLDAVKQDGYALKYVKDQTVEICLAAVKQNRYVLKYVKDQTVGFWLRRRMKPF